jgi:hypothetical protein
MIFGNQIAHVRVDAGVDVELYDGHERYCDRSWGIPSMGYDAMEQLFK